jgi:hypothetical protein
VAIRFQFNNETWEADTPEEAIALRAKLEYSTRFPPDPHEEIDKEMRFWTPDTVMSVLEGIGKLQHRMLMEIREQYGISGTQLKEKLGLESEIALAGVISGLSKQLKQLSIEPKQVFVINVRWTGKKKSRSFVLNTFFQSAAEQHNWPEAWAKKVTVGTGDHSR